MHDQMKKFNFVAYVAAAALLALGSCAIGEEKGTDPGDMTTVKFKLSYEGLNSRALADPMETNDPLTLQPGHIFFADGSGTIVRHVGIVADVAGGGAGSEQVELDRVLAGEAVILQVPATAQRCYILANDVAAKVGGDTGVTGNREGNDISTILGLTATVPNLNAATDISTVVQFGSGDIVPEAGVTETEAQEYDAWVEVDIRALTARIQVKRITGKVYNYTDDEDNPQTITIDDFTVEGIYVNNYYTSMTVNSTWPDGVVNHLSNIPSYSTAGTAPYSPTGNGYRLADLLNINDTGLAVAPADNTKVWAYNVFPTSTSAANNANVPHVIVKLSSVTFTDSGDGDGVTPTVLTDQFLTIANIKRAGGALLNAFEANNSYTFDNIAFDFTNLSDYPEVTELDILVTVKLLPWTDNPVEWDI
jgi:hypothetical protein